MHGTLKKYIRKGRNMNGFKNDSTYFAVLWFANDPDAYAACHGMYASDYSWYALQNAVTAKEMGIDNLGLVDWDEVACHINEREV